MAHGDDPVEVEVSHHAVERFRDLVRPGLTSDQAGDELVALLEQGGHWIARPQWVDDGVLLSMRWLALGELEGIALAVGDDTVVVTVVVRSGYRPDRPQRRARRSRESRSLRRKRAKSAKGSRSRDRRWEDDVA